MLPRSHPEDSAGNVEDILEELLQHREPEALQQYLRKVRALGRAAQGRPCSHWALGADRRGQACGPFVLRGPQCSVCEMGAAGHVALPLWVLSVRCLRTGPGPEQFAAPPGKASPDPDADLPGHLCRCRGQQAPAASGPGGGEAACPGTLGRLQVGELHGTLGQPLPPLWPGACSSWCQGVRDDQGPTATLSKSPSPTWPWVALKGEL